METSPATPPPLIPHERSMFLPQGRIGRAAFAIRFGIYIALMLALAFLQQVTQDTAIFPLSYYGAYPVFAFIIINGIKRVHDMGYSGWLILILGSCVPLMMFLPGQPEANKYGPPPTSTF